jgi:hypothetical protein
MGLRRITKRDGSGIQTDGSNVTEGDHSIDVKWTDWTGTTHRYHIRKDEIVDDREWPVGVFMVIGVIVLLLLVAQC